jgi:hypothetical protein
LCPGCGQPKHESFDPANEERYEAERLICYSCATRDRKAHKAHEAAEGQPLHGSYFVVYEAKED